MFGGKQTGKCRPTSASSFSRVTSSVRRNRIQFQGSNGKGTHRQLQLFFFSLVPTWVNLPEHRNVAVPISHLPVKIYADE